MLVTTSRTAETRAGVHPVGLSIAVLMLLLGTVSTASGEMTLGLLGIGVALVSFAIALPTHMLPATALICFAFLPTSYLDMEYGRLRGVVTPAIVLIVVWGLRLLGNKTDQPNSRRPVLLSIAVSATLLLLAYFGTDPSSSALWVMVVFFAVILPNALQVRIDTRTVEALWKTWVWVGAILAFYAVIESLSSFNPVSGLYAIEQKWSVYRVTTTLGHPLMNGMFFAVTALVLGLGAIKRREQLAGFVALLSVVATAFTGARSGVLALAGGLVVWLLLTTFSVRTNFTTKFVGTGFAIAAAALTLSNGTFRERLFSDEAIGSAQYRDTYGVGYAWALFDQNTFFGTGPGTSLYLITDKTGYVLESAVLGTLVSLGLIGASALLLILLAFVLLALKKNAFEVVAGLATFLVAGYAFPLWETRPSAFVMVTFLIILGTRVFAPQQPTIELPGSPVPVELPTVRA